MELGYTGDLSPPAERHAGSSPVTGTTLLYRSKYTALTNTNVCSHPCIFCLSFLDFHLASSSGPLFFSIRRSLLACVVASLLARSGFDLVCFAIIIFPACSSEQTYTSQNYHHTEQYHIQSFAIIFLTFFLPESYTANRPADFSPMADDYFPGCPFLAFRACSHMYV